MIYRGVCPHCGHTLLARPKADSPAWGAMWRHFDAMFMHFGRLFR